MFAHLKENQCISDILSFLTESCSCIHPPRQSLTHFYPHGSLLLFSLPLHTVPFSSCSSFLLNHNENSVSKRVYALQRDRENTTFWHYHQRCVFITHRKSNVVKKRLFLFQLYLIRFYIIIIPLRMSHNMTSTLRYYPFPGSLRGASCNFSLSCIHAFSLSLLQTKHYTYYFSLHSHKKRALSLDTNCILRFKL